MSLFNLILRDLIHGPKTEKAPADDEIAALGAKLAAATKAKLGRSLVIREVDAGSCNACELEVHALNNPIYDVERFGIKFAASPRHADVLLVTGPTARNMAEALKRTYDATPNPKWVIAMGDCACDGGLFKGSYAVLGGTDSVVPVDLVIPGCPPSPKDLLCGLLSLLKHVG